MVNIDNTQVPFDKFADDGEEYGIINIVNNKTKRTSVMPRDSGVIMTLHSNRINRCRQLL